MVALRIAGSPRFCHGAARPRFEDVFLRQLIGVGSVLLLAARIGHAVFSIRCLERLFGDTALDPGALALPHEVCARQALRVRTRKALRVCGARAR